MLAEFRRTREPERLARLMAHMDALIYELMEFGKRAMKKRSDASLSDSGQVGNRDSIFSFSSTKSLAALRACGFAIRSNRSKP